MFWSKAFIPTLKETPQEAESVSHQLMLRAGLIRPLMAGVYSYLPLGYRVLDKIENIVRQEMNACGAQELLLSALQPEELWTKSGRDEEIGQVMFRFTDRRGRKLSLGPTHEEIITGLVSNHVFSYRQLPLILYQIQVKFRDEIRPRFGLVRSCEFIMKDAYSFDLDEEGLKQSYDTMLEGYKRIFTKCGLSFKVVEADPGVMGGNLSHEFMVPAESGEDIILCCPDCGFLRSQIEDPSKCPNCSNELQKLNTIEVGHIFQLGTKYSKIFKAEILDQRGNKKPIIMGCYGIGVSRLIPAILEQNYDENGIIWPGEVAPFDIIILPLEVGKKKVYETGLNVYNNLKKRGFEVLLDDRDERAGIKFKDADLVGIPIQVIIGEKFLKENKIELKIRRSGERVAMAERKLSEEIGKHLSIK
jgi:prolyl-tRNA synthetase